MSNNLRMLIDSWNERRSVRTLLAADHCSLGELRGMQKELSDMDKLQRLEATKFLIDINKALSRRISSLKESSDQIKGQLKTSQQSRGACLAYHKQGRLVTSSVTENFVKQDLNINTSIGDVDDKA